MFRRIVYFLGLNFVLLMTFSLVMSVLPVPPGYYGQMIILYGLFGYGGAFISLLLSRKMAKWGKKLQLIDPKNPVNAQSEWLLKTVHQYARLSGIKVMPEVAVYQADELNAFATGPTKNRSLVAVSSGLLDNMTKDEVEGVLGHEIAHIKNGDMVTMVLLQGTINTLVMFAARILSDLVASRLSDGERGGFWIRMALFQVFAMLLGVLGMVVQGTFSRHREFRADAGGAKLAGPDKMVKSLLKLQSVYDPKQKKAMAKEPIAAMQISGYFRQSSFAQLLSTHPPLDKRIAALKKRML
jgi:heat shock protein HtpX